VEESEREAVGFVEANRYMVLGTADGAGVPWVSPVYFAAVGLRRFLWVSKPGARHSRNLAEQAAVSIVVFDSTVPIFQGRGLYMTGIAGEVPADEQVESIDVFSRRTLSHGAEAWSVDDVGPSTPFRLYRADIDHHWVLDDHDERIPFTPA
jgi:nitroimidazol reductase NimA-like FMN-containing flavoprotein (pyridoxamine 5'-phosphate oxidase superfamily)